MNHIRTRSLVPALALGCLLVGGLGCSKDSGSDGPKTPTAADLIEYDLSPAGDKWKGWTAKGPKGCKVMQDLGAAARIACDGPGMDVSSKTGQNGFDLAFKHGHDDLAKLKTLRKKSWDKLTAAGEHTMLSDKPDLLMWRDGKGKFNAYHIMMHLKVSGQDATCKTNLMVGGGTEAEHALHLAACATLAKK